MVPTQLRRLVDGGGAGLAALRAFDAVLIGAAATPPDLAARARDAGVRIVPAYGMSETASGCVYAGRPLAITRVRLADPDAAGAGGIELAGPMLAHGYRRAPTETARGVRGRLVPHRRHRASRRRGPVRGARPHRRHDQHRWRQGRSDTGGAGAGGPAGARAACVVGVPDPDWGQAVVAAVVPVDPADPPAVPALADAVRAAAGRAAAPKRIRFVAALPVRGPGKTDRAAVADAAHGVARPPIHR